MSKYRRYGGKLPRVQKRIPDDEFPSDEIPARRSRARSRPRKSEQDNQMVTILVTSFLSFIFVAPDMSLMSSISPLLGNPQDSYMQGLVLFFVGTLIFCEFRLILGRSLHNPEDTHRFRISISQAEFQNPSFNIPPFLSQIYLWIMGLHVLVIIILANLFDASIALQTSTVISLAIAVHALTVWLRYLISCSIHNR